MSIISAIGHSFHQGLRWHRAFFAWLLFGMWLSFGTRIALFDRMNWPTILDDSALVLTILTIVSLLETAPRIPRLTLYAIFGLLLSAITLANVLHYEYFESFINIESLLLLGAVPEARDSVINLLSLPIVFCCIAIPLLMLVATLHYGSRFRSRRLTIAPLLTALATAGFLYVHQRTVPATYSASFHNPVMLFIRQSIQELSGDDTFLSTDIAVDIQTNITSTYNFPSPALYATHNPRYPLWKTPVAAPRSGVGRLPNIIILLTESIRAYETALYTTHNSSFTPNIKRLSEQALHFANFYAIGHQTIRGEAAILCSLFLNFDGAPIYIRYPSLRVKCLPSILRDHGYSTHWISSFTADYCNKRKFLLAHGIEQIHDMKGVGDDLLKPRIGWGPADENLMQYAIGLLKDFRQPFFAEIMTLSNHHPFDYQYPAEPPDELLEQTQEKLYRNYLRGVYYTDHAVGSFFDKAKSQPWYDNTIFVIASDHGVHVYPKQLDLRRQPAMTKEVYHRSPLLIIGPDLTPRRMDVVASQVDVAPTLLDILGIAADNSFMGISLLDKTPKKERFVVMGSGSEWHIRQGNLYCYALGVDCLEAGYPRCPPEKGQVISTHSCFQTEYDLLQLTSPQVNESLKLLTEDQQQPLLSRLDRVIRYTNYLLRTDSIYPVKLYPSSK